MLILYANIKKRRKELGMTQEDLAKKCGYTSRTSIAKIENGDIDLPQSKILLFAKALETTPAALMGNDGVNEELNSEAFRKRMHEEYGAVFDMLEKATPEDRKKAEQMLKIITDSNDFSD